MLNFDAVDLTQKTKAYVASVSRYSMDGNEGCNVFWVQAADTKAENRIGWEIMKSSAEMDLFDEFRRIDDGNWPKLMEFEYTHKAMGGGKAGFHIVSFELVEQKAKPATSAPADKPQQNNQNKG